ncbi:MAG: DUF1192 family protein, partial [Planctomycetota bacterium]
QLIVLDGHGNAKHFLGNYSDYLREQAQASKATAPAGEKPAKKAPASKKPEAAKPKPAQDTGGRSGKNKKNSHRNKSLSNLDQAELEKRIETLEGEIAGLDAQLADPETYRQSDLFSELQDKRESLARKLAPLEAEWSARA